MNRGALGGYSEGKGVKANDKRDGLYQLAGRRALVSISRALQLLLHDYEVVADEYGQSRGRIRLGVRPTTYSRSLESIKANAFVGSPRPLRKRRG